MFASVTRHAFQLHCHVPDFLCGAVLLEQPDKLLLLLKGLGERHAHLKRNQLRHAICQSVWLTLNTRHVPHNRLGSHGAKSDDLGYRLPTVGLRDVFDHFITPFHTEVDVKVRHRDPLGVEKALEEQVIRNRVQVGNTQRIRDQGARARSTSRTHRDILLFGPSDEVHDHQEVAGESHLVNRIELKVEPFAVGRQLLICPIGETLL